MHDLSRRSQRGASILASLVFIGILAAAGLFLQSFQPPADSRMLTAQAAASTAGPTPVDVACTNIQAAAAAKDQGGQWVIDPDLSSQDSNGNIVVGISASAQKQQPTSNGSALDDKCVSVIYQAPANPPANTDPKKDPNNYVCHGANATLVYTSADALLVAHYTPNPDPTSKPGVCETQVCSDAQGDNCHPASLPTLPTFEATNGTNVSPSVSAMSNPAGGVSMPSGSMFSPGSGTGSGADTSGSGSGDTFGATAPAGTFANSSLCQDTLASNYGDPLPCTYGSKVSAGTGQFNAANPAGPGAGNNNICPPGQYPGLNGCATPNNNPNNPYGGQNMGPQPYAPSTFGGNNALGSLLAGLSRGLGTPPPPPPPMPAQQAQSCSTDPNAYAQQQQQYQQQLQQYNYQLQMYQYQQQMQQYNATYGTGSPYGYGSPYGGSPYGYSYGYSPYGGYGYPQMPQPPQPCSPSTQQQCPAQVQQPAPSTCTTGSWQPQYNGSCITNWQCVQNGNGSNGVMPVAQLSCQPNVADVGMSIAMTYSCSSGTATSSGFAITTQPLGSATAVVQTPLQGANTATYYLGCINGTQVAGAQCSVQVNQPSIVLIAQPNTVPYGDTANIGWVTTGMQSCVVSSPDQPNFTAQNAYNTSANGTAQTPPLTAPAEFLLHCTTAAGGTKDATTTVLVSGGSATSTSATSTITVSSSAGSSINHGDNISVTWSSTGEPSGAAVSLWLISASGAGYLIAGAQPLSGSYSWNVPAASSTCPTDGAANVCGADLVAGGGYVIEADVYAPSNAYVGDGAPPASPVAPSWYDHADTPILTVGQ